MYKRQVLVFYQGRVGYAPTISQALSQVGINPAAAQEIEVVDDGAATTGEDAAPEAPEAPAALQASGSTDEALNRINTALRNLETARGGSFEEFGSALDELDRAVQDYQALNTQ